MIAVSMLLIAGSAAALGFGWITANESLVWASIVATGAAAILLALTYYLSIRAAGAPVDARPDDDRGGADEGDDSVS